MADDPRFDPSLMPTSASTPISSSLPLPMPMPFTLTSSLPPTLPSSLTYSLPLSQPTLPSSLPPLHNIPSTLPQLPPSTITAATRRHYVRKAANINARKITNAATAATDATAATAVTTSRTSRTQTPGTPRTASLRQGRRTRLTMEERAKVLEVRRQRACLRCKMLKIQCSKENPCRPCLSSAVRGHERKVLSFCYCVRTRFAEVDIFRSIETSTAPEIPASVCALMDQIETPAYLPMLVYPPEDEQQLQLEAQQRWQHEQNGDDGLEPYGFLPPMLADHPFEESLLRWLACPGSQPPGRVPMPVPVPAAAPSLPTPRPTGDTSFVGMLCATVGASASLQRAVDEELTSDFRTFLCATTLAHTGWRGAVPHQDLCVAGHLCGSRLVRRLDRILTPQFLAKCDHDTHRALLLLLFGLILGVSYSARLAATVVQAAPSASASASASSALASGLAPPPEMRHSPTLWLTMKEHLAQMLAHHLIFIGSILGIKLDTAAERTIIDAAVNRWNKPERSLWALRVLPTPHNGLGLSPPSDLTPDKEAVTPAATTAAPSDLTIVPDPADPASPRTLPPLPQPQPQSPLPMLAAQSMAAQHRQPLVAVAWPDVAVLQQLPPSTIEPGDNPSSFLDMANEEVPGLVSAHEEQQVPSEQPPDSRQTTQPDPKRRIFKRRSVWAVRPYDDGGAQEPVNMFARLQLPSDQNVGMLV